MKKTDHLLVFQLLAGCSQLLQGDVISFNLASGSIPRLGETVQLICKVTGRNIAIKKTTSKIYATQQDWTTCSSVKCTNVGEGYNVARSVSSVTITITALSRDEDEKWWTCVSSNALQLKLVVYTVPTSVSLADARPCDLALSSCVYTCTTSDCTYPEPTFIWFYLKNNGDTTEKMFGSYEGPGTAIQNSCSNSEGLFEGKIEIPRYATSPDIAIKTIKLQCMIQFPELTLGPRSGFSGNLQFAVKVSTVTIFDRQRVLKAGDRLAVQEFEKEILRCEPGYGHPSPSINWYIGEIIQSSDATFSLIPTNSIHGQAVYCKTFNIPGSWIDSVKAILYVKVKIKNVYLEPAWDSTISVIENTTEPVVCVTSRGRPGATIKWLEYNSDKDLGPSDFIEHIITNEDLNITRATKNVLVSRQDKGWILTCEARNTDVQTILANNSKSFNVLYPPEMMGISYSDERVTGAVIDVVRGTNVSFKCIVDCNPPVQTFSWSMRGVKLEGEIITIENIRNNQTVQCTATNTMKSTSGFTKQGSGSITKEINVLYPPTITRFAVLRIGMAESGDTLTVNENALMSLVCDVDSNPGSNISLKQSRKILSERQNSHNLEYNICSAKCSHNGEYTCTAWNKIKTEATAESKLQINVRCSPVLAEETDTTVIGLQNESTILSVTIIAFPMPTHYNWFKNTSSGWQEVTNSSDIEITQTSLEFSLKIRQVKDEDYGIYNLTVGNGIGQPSGFLLLLQAKEEPKRQSDAQDNGSMAGIIGGVIGGLLVAGLVVAVLCILRWRNCFDGMKTNLFRSKSKISRNVTASKLDEGTGYENLSILTDTSTTANPSKKEKVPNVKETNLTSQSYDGLKNADIVFSAHKASTSSKRKNNNGGQTQSKRNASQMEEESGNEGEHRAEPVAYEELGGTREQSHVYKTLQQDTRFRAHDSTYEGIDSRHRRDHTYESMH